MEFDESDEPIAAGVLGDFRKRFSAWHNTIATLSYADRETIGIVETGTTNLDSVINERVWDHRWRMKASSFYASEIRRIDSEYEFLRIVSMSGIR
jgi:hypothetical protein